MIWKIIILLLCFTVLVNASSSCSASCSGCIPTKCLKKTDKPKSSKFIENTTTNLMQPTLQFSKIEEWIESLEVKTVKSWSTLATASNKTQLDIARTALNNSKCPTGVVDTLILNSKIQNWPKHLLNKNKDGYDLDKITKFKCRCIPGAPVVYVARSDNELVPPIGLLLILDNLEFE